MRNKIQILNNELKEFINILGLTKQKVKKSARTLVLGSMVTFMPLESSTVKLADHIQISKPVVTHIIKKSKSDNSNFSLMSWADSVYTDVKQKFVNIFAGKPRMDFPSLNMDVSTTRYDGRPEFLENYLQGVLKGKSKAFCNAQDKYNINATFLIGIANHETGYGSSSVAHKYNNVGGMRNSKGYIKYNSVEECIDSIASNLNRNYIKKGLNTPPEIGKKYCETSSWPNHIVYQMKKIYKGTQSNNLWF